MAPTSSRGSLRSPLRAVLLLAAGASAGCASKTVQLPQGYSLDGPAPAAAPAAAGGFVLALARVDVAAPYAGAALVYRTGGHRVERDPYARFAASPGALLTSAIRGYLRNAPYVGDVVAPAGSLPVAAAIEVSAGELYGDLAGSPGAAVLSLHFRVLTRSGAAGAEREVFQKTYDRRIDLPEKTADAVVRAWNEGLAQIMQAFVADLQPVLEKPPNN